MDFEKYFNSKLGVEFDYNLVPNCLIKLISSSPEKENKRVKERKREDRSFFLGVWRILDMRRNSCHLHMHHWCLFHNLIIK